MTLSIDSEDLQDLNLRKVPTLSKQQKKVLKWLFIAVCIILLFILLPFILNRMATTIYAFKNLRKAIHT